MQINRFEYIIMNKLTEIEADRIISVLDESIEKIGVLNYIPYEPNITLTDTVEVALSLLPS